MLLALDVGNTNITLGVYEGEKLLFVTRMATKIRRAWRTNTLLQCSAFYIYTISTRRR